MFTYPLIALQRQALLLLIGSWLALPFFAGAEIIPPSRRIDWNPGIPGGIPRRTNEFANVRNAPYNARGDGIANDAPAIQAAIDACPSNRVVYLPPGTYRVASPINMKPGITFRGAGTNTIVMVDHFGHGFYFAYGLGRVAVDVTSGLQKGSSNLVLAAPPQYLVPGNHVLIDQLNDPTLVTPDGYEGGTALRCTYCGRDSGNRAVGQVVRVESVSGNSLVIHPPLYVTYSNRFSPQIYYPADPGNGNGNLLGWNGIEDLQISRTETALPMNMIRYEYSAYCWVKNVFFNRGSSSANIYTYFVRGLEIRDSFFNRSPGLTSNSGGGVVMFPGSSDCLIENNIVYGIREPIVLAGPCMGNVIAYNYVSFLPNINQNVLMMDMAMHGAHPMMNLFEGNVIHKFHADFIHGSASHNTLFRNYIKGRQEDVGGIKNNAGSGCIWIDATNHYFNAVGNVLGYAGITNDARVWTMDMEAPQGGGFNFEHLFVWRWSYSGYSPALRDPLVRSTVLRHGNYDFFSNSTQWDASNPDRSLPPSLYHKTKPAWFGKLAWPPFGPENVASGIYTLNAATNIPAGYRFLFGNVGLSPTIPPPTGARTNNVSP